MPNISYIYNIAQDKLHTQKFSTHMKQKTQSCNYSNIKHSQTNHINSTRTQFHNTHQKHRPHSSSAQASSTHTHMREHTHREYTYRMSRQISKHRTIHIPKHGKYNHDSSTRRNNPVNVAIHDGTAHAMDGRGRNRRTELSSRSIDIFVEP